MPDFSGWKFLAEHLTTQQRVALKAELDAQNGDNTTVVHQMDNGWSVRKLNHEGDFQTEGKLMDNCVSTYSPDRGYNDVHSLRDENNLPFISFQMRRRTSEDHNGYGSWSRNGEPGDTGKDVLTTTQVLGRNNEEPKEEYGINLVKGLSGIAKAEGIPHISWNRGNLQTPEEYDDFYDESVNEKKPDNLYMKVPVGGKREDGGIDFTNDDVLDNTKLSTEPYEPQFGFHIIKTPFSEKRFAHEDDIQKRLNGEGKSSAWKVRTQPGSGKALTEGLKPSLVTMVHEARNPDHVYIKTSASAFATAKNGCETCDGTGKEDKDDYYNDKKCQTCGGSGKGGDKFLIGKLKQGYYDRAEATPDVSDFHDEHGEYKDMDNVVIKVPFSEDHFSFNPGTGKYAPKNDAPAIPSASVEMTHKRHLPSHIYVAVPSKERQNKMVYSSEGLEPAFMRNEHAMSSPSRPNFVGAAGNDILRIDTSKLEDDSLLEHTQDYPGGQTRNRRRNYDVGRVNQWKLNASKPIPYEAITDVNGALDMADMSTQNKRRKPVTPEPTDIHNPKLHVPWPEEEAPKSVSFRTNVSGHTLSSVRHLEQGNITADIGSGKADDPNENTGSGDVQAKVKYDPDLMTETTPTLADIRATHNPGGSHRYPGVIERDGIRTKYDWENMPQSRYFHLNQDLPAGHPNLESVSLGARLEKEPGEEDKGSIIPDTAFLHVPRRLRGNEELYGDKGIDVSKITDRTRPDRASAELQKMWQNPITGEANELRSGEDPHDLDVWAVDLKQMGHATFTPSENPKNNYSGERQQAYEVAHLQHDIPCGQCNGSGVNTWDNGNNTGICGNCNGSGKQESGTVVPWSAIKRLHRKPEEPTAPAIRKFFNTAHVTGWRHLTLIDPR